MVRPYGALAAQSGPAHRLASPVVSRFAPGAGARRPARVVARLAFTLLLVLSVAGEAAIFSGSHATAQDAGLGATTDLNLRANPWVGADVLTVIPAGGAVSTTGDDRNGFTGVSFNGVTGYAFSDYLSSTASRPNVDRSNLPAYQYQGASQSDTGAGASGTTSVSSALNLRADASLSSDVLTVMPGGATVSLLGQEANGFALVSWQGQQGWAATDFLGSAVDAVSEPTKQDPVAGSDPTTGADPAANTSGQTSSAPSGQVWATSAVNVRSGPGTSYSVLTVMPGGASATGQGTAQNGFWSLNYNGTVGWASSDFLSTSGGAVDQPPANAGSVDQSAYGGGEAQIIQIIYNAADSYGQPREDMLRVARCESVLDPNAVNAAGGSYGLFQFIPSTWATTPYAQYDIFDPWANANAAAWMWSQGRRNEWVCQ